MKLSRLGKFVFFILSYYLLFVILLIENQNLKSKILDLKYFSIGSNWVILLALTVFVIVSILYIFHWKKLPKKVFEIKDIKNISTETLNYLVTFMLGLFFFTGSIYSMKLWILILLLYLIYQSGGIYYLQPLLMLFGYQVYKCKIDNGNTIMILSNNNIAIGKKELDEFFEGIYLLKEARK